jgi:hypothetical protein
MEWGGRVVVRAGGGGGVVGVAGRGGGGDGVGEGGGDIILNGSVRRFNIRSPPRPCALYFSGGQLRRVQIKC